MYCKMRFLSISFNYVNASQLQKRAVVEVLFESFSFIYFVFYFMGGANCVSHFTYEGGGQ